MKQDIHNIQNQEINFKSINEGKDEWFKTISGINDNPIIKIWCDFGSCQIRSIFQCKKCNDHLCANHLVLHKQSCGMLTPIKYDYEDELDPVLLENKK